MHVEINAIRWNGLQDAINVILELIWLLHPLFQFFFTFVKLCSNDLSKLSAVSSLTSSALSVRLKSGYKQVGLDSEKKYLGLIFFWAQARAWHGHCSPRWSMGLTCGFVTGQVIWVMGDLSYFTWVGRGRKEESYRYTHPPAKISLQFWGPLAFILIACCSYSIFEIEIYP